MKVTELLCKTTSETIVRLAALAVLCLAIGFPTLAAHAADDFSVILLGAGTPTPLPNRFGPSTLVEVGGKRLLFDMGRGATIRINQLLIPIGSIDAHFLTHLHSDHVNGLADVWMTGWLRKPIGGRETPFLIYGPAGTENMMAALWKAYSEDRRIRMADEHLPEAGIRIEAHDVPLGVLYNKDGIVVTAFESDHGDLIKPTYGYKVTYGGRSVVIAGDSRYCEGVKNAATGADLLIHSVAMLPEALKQKFKSVLDHHISPERAGELFAAAKPKMAVFHHLVLISDPKEGINPMTPADILAATRTIYNGPVLVGADLMGFKIDDTGVSIIQPPRQ